MPGAERGRLVGRHAEIGRLRALLRDAAVGALADGPLRDALAARPVLSRLLPDAGGGQPPVADAPGLAQQQLFGAVLGLLSELAETSPVLLVLEDLHWADRSTPRPWPST